MCVRVGQIKRNRTERFARRCHRLVIIVRRLATKDLKSNLGICMYVCTCISVCVYIEALEYETMRHQGQARLRQLVVALHISATERDLADALLRAGQHDEALAADQMLAGANLVGKLSAATIDAAWRLQRRCCAHLGEAGDLLQGLFDGNGRHGARRS